MLRKKFLLVVAAAAALGALTAAGPASADLPLHSGRFDNYGKLSGTGIHIEPQVGKRVVSMVAPGQRVVDLCYKQGDKIGSNEWWDLVYHPGTNVAGFTNDSYLRNPYNQSLWCDNWEAMRDTYGFTATNRPSGETGVHTCTNNTCQVMAMMDAGVWATQFCYSYGANLGTPSNRWSLVYYNGQAGWVHQYWLRDYLRTTVQC